MRSSEARWRGSGRLWTLTGVALLSLGVVVVLGLQRSGEVAAQERPARGRPLPRFEGPRLDGEGRLSTDVFRGRRGLLANWLVWKGEVPKSLVFFKRHKDALCVLKTVNVF